MNRLNAFFHVLRPYLVTVVLIMLAALLRIWPLHILELRIVWLTFYPAVMVSAILGGFTAGVLGALHSCGVIIFFWPLLVSEPYIKDYADWLGAGVFLLNGVMISAIAQSSRRAQRRARLAQAQAETASRAKSIFLANMSHELRTPLNAVLGFSRLLKQAENLTPDQVTQLDIITQSGEHLLNLINNILDISKIETGKVVLEETETNLHNLVHVKAIEKRLDFYTDIAPNLPRYVWVDAGKLRQVLLNLLGNAIKFTPGGFVRLSARPLERTDGPKTWLRFEVQDSGPGISAQEQQQLFHSFVQLKRYLQQETGAGLGLAICKQNVALMGGVIGVNSQLGQGAMFYFEIPAAVSTKNDLPAAPQFSRAVAIAQGQSAVRLLIAEDNVFNRLLLRQMLEPLGFEMREAANGQEAVALFESWRPHLIWMDIRMPVMDGLEASRLIKAAAGGQAVKIVALTAHALEEERLEILAAGCDDFIRKPYHDTEILEALTRHLGIQFVYESGPQAQKPPDAFTLQAADLQRLPPSLRGQLAQAVEQLDSGLCYRVIQQVQTLDVPLSERLSKAVKAMQYNELLDLFDELAAAPTAPQPAASPGGRHEPG